MKEPFNRNEAKKRIQAIFREENFIFTGHAEQELANDGLTTNDARNVLRAGKILKAPELRNGTWRYNVETEQMVVVVAFVSESEMKIITAWRK